MDASATNLASNYLPIGIQLIFAAGFITASFLTHGYFKNAYESKVNQTLKQPNIPNE